MERRRALAFLAASALAAPVAACGISAFGSYVLPEVNGEAGSDGGPTADAGGPDESEAIAQARCLTVCDAGTCERGTCRIACERLDSCASTVRCPPGVACNVSCSGKDSCANGVDCSGASSCTIACTGEDACDGKVVCTGTSCDVRCDGPGSACANGISCDAGTCKAVCRQGDCTNGLVECFANDCTVLCGADAGEGAGAPSGACTAGVRCTAATSCNVECNGESTCRNGGVVAVAAQNAFVRCTGNQSCEALVAVSAGDGGIHCGPGDGDTCKNGPKCDGGLCTFLCGDGNNNVAGCCRATACKGVPLASCTVETMSCP